MDYATSMMVVITVAREDFELYGRLGARWLTELPRSTNPELLTRVRAGDPDVDTGLTVTPWVGGPIRGGEFDNRKFEQAIVELSRPVETVSISAETDEEMFDVSVSWSERLRMQFVAKIANDAAGMDVQVFRLLDFLKDFLDEVDPDYGFASTKYFFDMATELDLALRRYYWDSISQSRNLLRGYSWLTVVPQELVARLGGKEAFEHEGFKAYPLAAGGLIVLATRTPVDYDEAAMQRLFRFVAPVLPPGQPKPIPGYPEIKIILQDASMM